METKNRASRKLLSLSVQLEGEPFSNSSVKKQKKKHRTGKVNGSFVLIRNFPDPNGLCWKGVLLVAVYAENKQLLSWRMHLLRQRQRCVRSKNRKCAERRSQPFVGWLIHSPQAPGVIDRKFGQAWFPKWPSYNTSYSSFDWLPPKLWMGKENSQFIEQEIEV